MAGAVALDGALGLEQLPWDWNSCPGIGKTALGLAWGPLGGPGGPREPWGAQGPLGPHGALGPWAHAALRGCAKRILHLFDCP